MFRKVCVFDGSLPSLLNQQRRLIAQLSSKEIRHSEEWDNAKPFKEIPGLSGFQFVRGFLPGGRFANKTPYDMMDISRQMFGDIFMLPGLFGKKSMLMTFNPDDFPKVLRSEGTWPKRRGLETMAYYRKVQNKEAFGDVVGLLSSNDEVWGKLRSAVNPILMQPKNARLYISKMLEVNDEFLERIREIRDPKTMEVPDTFEDEINRLTFESVAVISLNRQLGLIRKNRNDDEAKRIFEGIRSIFDLTAELDMAPSIWKIIKTPKFHKIMKSHDEVYKIIMKYVIQAVESIENDSSHTNDNEEKSVLEKLLKIDKKVAMVMAFDLLIAGVDTTTSTLVGILLCIAKNPDKQEKLREEIRTILPQKDSILTTDNMKHLPYLRACIKEGIRMYPIGGGTLRTAGEDIVLSGYQVPKGEDIIIAHNLLLQDEKHCPRAKEFIPERWLRDNKSNHEPINPFLYMPFSHGPRSCVGKRIVEMELEITVARLVRNFEMEFNYPTDKAFKTRLINVPAIPLKFKFIGTRTASCSHAPRIVSPRFR